MAKVKQKVSGCFRAVSFARTYCRISIYLQTMAALGYNPLVAITIAPAGKGHRLPQPRHRMTTRTTG